MFKQTMRFLAVAATAFVFSVGQAYAQAEPTGCAISQQPAVAPFNLRQLHDQLNLSATQEVQWQTAVDAMRETHAAERMNADQMQAREETLLQQPILDLSALHAAHENVVAQDAPLPEQSAKAWLTFYSGLSDQQKTIFSAALRPYLEEVAHHAARPFEPRTGL
ncbi:periplasmic heavy metal sensor [Paraburkholderia sp. SOS3]|jgi:protein CpxP|uniref:periplasmic heavy metal sensor n=1 Tax=Paraburkholderia sp. SOS3 TaxID=1926494 RepID=UPI0009477A68|nr:periplasmic heavy metal sensor [Paraburkholderia sp. SOS3]APR35524.1 hypothetical protein BTO02_08930 [Paraburkholderia sp. SOS3]